MPLPIPALAPGQLAPNFEATALDGQPFSLAAARAARPVLLVFYRGGWCPICNSQINALTLEAAAFDAKAVSLVALSNEPPTRGVEVLRRYGSRFPLIHDDGGLVIARYGLRDPSSPYPGYEDTAGYARPAAVLIDRAGVIRWAYVGDGPRDRPSTADLLAAIDQHLTTAP